MQDLGIRVKDASRRKRSENDTPARIEEAPGT
jgi:hypothetical protein